MTTPTAPERLSRAFVTQLVRLYNWNQECLKSNMKWGMCVANAKYSPFMYPTPDVMDELVGKAKDQFKASGEVDAFYFQYWTPPLIKIDEGRDKNALPVAEDFLLTFSNVTLDDFYEQRFLARNLAFCPAESELGRNHKWYSLQEEAIRLTPLLHKEIEELKFEGSIRLALLSMAYPEFDLCVRNYIQRDRNIGISESERKAFLEGKSAWKELYPNLTRLVTLKEKNLLQAYRICIEKARETRNTKIKPLLQSFVRHIENKFILQSGLSESRKQELINVIRGDSHPKSKKKYTAKRPALCLSDIECGQMLYLMMVEFTKNPKKQRVVGESLLFVLIAQHAAYSGLTIKVENILNLNMNDISTKDLTINICGGKIRITIGLAQILEAWVGSSKRDNLRSLFAVLNRDKLEKCLGKISKGFFGVEGKVIPSDFLHKTHVIPGMRISVEFRRKLDEQELLIKDSPYRVNTEEIKKHILDACSQKCA